MENEIKLLIQTGHNFISLIKNFSHEQLNMVPTRFSNSIAWNLAHILVVQQLLHYFLSDNALYIPKKWIEKYKKGTQVKSSMSKEELQQTKEFLIDTPLLLKKDYQKGIFESYQKYPTSYGVVLYSIKCGIQFNNLHEGLHFGYVLAMIKNLT